MRDTDFLIGFANLSVVLAGFVSIFLVLLTGALIPFIFDFFEWAEEQVYQISAALSLALFSLCLFVVNYQLFRLKQDQVKEVGYLHLILSYSLSSLAGVLILAAAAGYQPRATYLSGLVVGYFIGALGFLSFAIKNFVLGRETTRE